MNMDVCMIYEVNLLTSLMTYEYHVIVINHKAVECINLLIM